MSSFFIDALLYWTYIVHSAFIGQFILNFNWSNSWYKTIVINIFLNKLFCFSLFKIPWTFGEILWTLFFLFSLLYCPTVPLPFPLFFPFWDFWGRGTFIIYIILPEVFFLRTCILTRLRSFSLWHWIVSFHHMVVWLFRSFHLMVIGLFWSFLLV